MSGINRGLVCILAAAALIAATPAAGSDRGEAAAKLRRLRAEIAKLNASVGSEIAHKHRLGAELGQLERRIGSLHRELTSLAARAQALGKREQTLDHEVAASRNSAQTAEKELAAALRAAFVLGRQPALKLALEGNDPASVARLLGYYGYYTRARADQIAELTASIAHYRKLRDEFSATQKEVEQTAAARQKALATLESSRDKRRTLITKLSRDIADKNARIATLRRDAERLEEVIRSVSRDLAEVPSEQLDQEDFAKLRGRLPWPVAGRIVNGFGSSRADAGALKWEAVRIAAPEGTKVRAVAYGRVAYAGWLPYYGLVLMVDHGDGYLTVYGHNEALYKQVGDWVQAGDEIATVGTSGGQPKPLLYFQIRHGDHSLDPERWCNNGRSSSQ